MNDKRNASRGIIRGGGLRQLSKLFCCAALIAVAGAFLVVSSTGSVQAYDKSEGDVKLRVDNMQTMARAYQNLVEMFKGKVQYDVTYAKGYADALKITSRYIKRWFERKDMSQPSESLPAIWTNWDDFSKLSDEAYKETGELHRLIRTGADKPSIILQFKTVETACSSCHEKYRKSGGGLQPDPAYRHGQQ